MDQPVVEQPMERVPPADAPSYTGQKNTLMAVLSYIGPLVIVSYLMAKDDSFVKFHIRQGAVLFGIEIALSILASMFWWLYVITQFVNLGMFVLSIIGIMNAIHGKEKELPLVGHLAVHVPL
jgi:uncharacterized membrane protein